MYPLDDRALALLPRSHGVDARLFASINGSDFDMPLQLAPGGSVGVDGKSPARRKLSAQVVADLDDAGVDPFAAEVRAEYAIVDPTSGVKYWTPVGTFVLTNAQQQGGIVSIEGADRWQRVVDARFERSITTSGNTVSAIRQLLLDADSRITVDSSAAPTGYTHRTSLWERDRDKAIIELAQSIGCVVYFDPLGVARIEPLRPLGADPDWTIGPGMGGVKVGSARGVSRANTYNAVTATGESDGVTPAVYATARDSDPSSVTRWGGPFGKRTRFYSSSLVTTAAQALAVAGSLLDRVSGVARTVTVEALPHPGLDAGDLALVHVQGETWQQHRVGSFTLPLGLGTITIDAATGADDDAEGE